MTRTKQTGSEVQKCQAKEKPKISVINIGGGQVRIVNCKAAADYCGISSQNFGRVIRRAIWERKRPRNANRPMVWAVKECYPELFKGDALADGVMVEIAGTIHE